MPPFPIIQTELKRTFSCMAAGRIGHTTGESQIPEGGVPMSRDNANNNGKKSQPGNNQDSEVAESKTKK